MVRVNSVVCREEARAATLTTISVQIRKTSNKCVTRGVPILTHHSSLFCLPSLQIFNQIRHHVKAFQILPYDRMMQKSQSQINHIQQSNAISRRYCEYN